MTDERRDDDARQTEPERVQCRRCGCRHLLVVYTRPRPRGIMRKRRCRHCGAEFVTYERPL